MDALQTSVLSALNTYDAGPYGSGNVEITDALGTALGLTGLTGTTATGASCSFPSAGCYNAVVTVTNDPGTPLYYDNLGGTEPSDVYDIYSAIAHETDEVLGTASCISTTSSSGLLTDSCDSFGGTGTPSAVDLFRYNSLGSLALNGSYIGLASAPAAHISRITAAPRMARLALGEPKYYNTLANGDDYADFVPSTPDCGTNQDIQDAEGCPGEDAGLSPCLRQDPASGLNPRNNRGRSGPSARPRCGRSLPPRWFDSGVPHKYGVKNPITDLIYDRARCSPIRHKFV